MEGPSSEFLDLYDQMQVSIAREDYSSAWLTVSRLFKDCSFDGLDLYDDSSLRCWYVALALRNGHDAEAQEQLKVIVQRLCDEKNEELLATFLSQCQIFCGSESRFSAILAPVIIEGRLGP